MYVIDDATQDLLDRDPEGWTTREPTEADRDAFREYALCTYGAYVWASYLRGESL